MFKSKAEINSKGGFFFRRPLPAAPMCVRYADESDDDYEERLEDEESLVDYFND